MKLLDRMCSAALFMIALVDCLLVPKNYTGRIWIFGTGLALLFTAMLNQLRIRNRQGVMGLRSSCFGANVMMFAFSIALMASIGRQRSLQHPQLPIVAALLFGEILFSLGMETWS